MLYNRRVPAKVFLYHNCQLSKYVLKLAKNQFVVATSLPPPRIPHVKDDEYSAYPPSGTSFEHFSIMHYESAPDCLERLRGDKKVQQNDDYNLNKKWQDESTIADKYENHRSEFLDVFAEFANRWTVLIRRIMNAKHHMLPTDDSVHLVHSAPYKTMLFERHFTATEIVSIRQKEVIETTDSRMGRFNGLRAEENGSILLYVNYHKLNTVTIGSSYLLLECTSVSIQWMTSASSGHYMPVRSISKSKLTDMTDKNSIC